MFAGTWRDEQWPDNWTAVTADGKLSAQFEHTLLVTGEAAGQTRYLLTALCWPRCCAGRCAVLAAVRCWPLCCAVRCV